MRILIIGSNGQLGTALRASFPEENELTAVDYPQIDLCSRASVEGAIKKYQPDMVVNAAAYTAVDLAETEYKKAELINATGVRHLAGSIKKAGARMVHISTDFVFDGKKGSPYLPDDTPLPLSVYGKTKYEGEKALLEELETDALIIRTAWLYSVNGSNFVKTMLKLMAERDSLNVVEDQIGTPCLASGLAEAVWSAVAQNCKGIFHWTDAGVASWYDFAVAIQEEALNLGLLDVEIPVIPVPSSAYPVPAKRPSCSVLDKTSSIKAFRLAPVHWRVQLRRMLKSFKDKTDKGSH